MTKHKKNQGRNYPASDWLEFMIEGEIESQGQAVRDGEHELSRDCYDTVMEVDAYDVEITPDLQKAKDEFERDVEKAVEEWTKKHPLREGVEVWEIMERGAPVDVYFVLDGSGAGAINEGEWNDYFVDGDDWSEKDLENFMDKRLGKYVDETGGGRIPMEMGDAVYKKFVEVCDERAGNPKKSRALKAKLLR